MFFQMQNPYTYTPLSSTQSSSDHHHHPPLPSTFLPVNIESHPPHPHLAGEDDSPLLPSPHRPLSGVSTAVFNLTTSIIGAGIMALPAAVKVLGVVLGLISITLIGILSEISVELLVRFSVFSNASTYGDLVNHGLGRHAKFVSEIFIVFNNAGILVVYLIIIGDVMTGSEHHPGVLDQIFGFQQRKTVIFLVVVFLLAPLCSLQRMESLGPSSAASVALAVVFVVAVCVLAGIRVLNGGIEPPALSPDLSSKQSIVDLLVAIPVMANAYVCHFNVQPIYNELEEKSPAKMNKVGRVTVVLCIVIYTVTAMAGYLLFGEETEPDILANFDTSALNNSIRVGYVLHLVLVFPVVHFSLREAVNSLLITVGGSSPSSCSSSLEGRWKRSLGLTVILLGVVYIGSTMVPNIWVAFRFTGATTAVSLGFIFPPLVALRLGRKKEELLCSWERGLAWIMLVLAMVVGVLGVVGNVYGFRK